MVATSQSPFPLLSMIFGRSSPINLCGKIAMTYEFFEHTADLGLRIRADTLELLLEEAARALFAAIVVNLDQVREVDTIQFEIEADRPDDLLRDWLAELLYVFHADHRLFAHFEVRLEGDRLEATARGEPIDPARHELDAEIKAITYHGLKVEREGNGWLAEVIVDL